MLGEPGTRDLPGPSTLAGVPLPRIGRALLLTLAFVSIGACGHDRTVDRAAPSTISTSAPSSVESTLATAPADSLPAGAVELSEADAGRTVALRVGDTVTVVLHQTYWEMAAPAPAEPVRETAAPVVAPRLQGCVPGGGCGTVTTAYVAVAAGSAAIGAHRQTCGEAMTCTPDQQDWQVTIVVA